MAKPIVSRPPSEQAQAPDVMGIRVTLFQAQGVIRAVRIALDTSDLTEGDDSLLAYALEAADSIIDDAASALEGVPHGQK